MASKSIDEKQIEVASNESWYPNYSGIPNNNGAVTEWQRVKEENEALKSKLKSTEETLQETLHKFAKSMEEKEKLRENLRWKQIEHQDTQLFCLKYGYKEIKALNKNSTENFVDNGLAQQARLAFDSETGSDEEFDLEGMKDFISMQRGIEMEENIRVMVQGLVELKEFLNSNCQSEVVELDTELRQSNVVNLDTRLRRTKNLTENFVDNGLSQQAKLAFGSETGSDEEFDLEGMKDFISMQRGIEMEEKNRVMVQGLVELKEFLNSNCQSEVVELDTEHRHSNVVNLDTKFRRLETGKQNGGIPHSDDSHIVIRCLDFSAKKSESQLKEYSKMLQEMTWYSEILKGNSEVATDTELSIDCKLAQKEFRENKKINRFSQRLPNLASNSNGKASLSIASIRKVPLACPNSSCVSSNDFQYHIQAGNLSSNESPLHYTSDMSASEELGDLIRSNQPKTVVVSNWKEELCRTMWSFMQENIILEERPEFQLSLSTSSVKMFGKSGNDNSSRISSSDFQNYSQAGNLSSNESPLHYTRDMSPSEEPGDPIQSNQPKTVVVSNWKEGPCRTMSSFMQKDITFVERPEFKLSVSTSSVELFAKSGDDGEMVLPIVGKKPESQ